MFSDRFQTDVTFLTCSFNSLSMLFLVLKLFKGSLKFCFCFLCVFFLKGIINEIFTGFDFFRFSLVFQVAASLGGG